MPVLELPQLHLPEAGVYLAAVMFHPREPARHAEFVQMTKNSVLQRVFKGKTHIPPALERDVIAAITGPRLTERTHDDAHQLIGQRYPRDLLAGLLLVYVLASADAGEPCSFEEAVTIFRTGAGARRGGIPGRSRSVVLETWSAFSPAAHLSATRLFLGSLWSQAAGNGTTLAYFLAYAEALRQRGEQHKTPHSKSTLLDPSETWTVPDWVILPEIELQLPSPTALRAALQTPQPEMTPSQN
jgi:hypothetical protein